MYTTKFMNKNVTVDNGRYITVGDPYIGTKDKLPLRWKEKQFHVPQVPSNAGEGYFGFSGKAFSYQSELYTEQRPYMKTQPPDKRKLGFGTHDASRRDEFSQPIRTEQYRETLKKEGRANNNGYDEDAIEELMKKENAKVKKFVETKKEIGNLYDVGRSIHTEFDPKNGRDQFYSMKHGYTYEKRMGNNRTASQDIGDGAWNFKYSKPEFSAPSQVKNFFDQSHLDIGGL